MPYKDKRKQSKNFLKWRLENRVHLNEYVKKWRIDLKTETVAYYSNGGMDCACCGVKGLIFLTIDHINNDGHLEEKNSYGSRRFGGQKFYAQLRKKGFPKGFQILCFNCNYAKGLNGGTCPHKD